MVGVWEGRREGEEREGESTRRLCYSSALGLCNVALLYEEEEKRRFIDSSSTLEYCWMTITRVSAVSGGREIVEEKMKRRRRKSK